MWHSKIASKTQKKKEEEEEFRLGVNLKGESLRQISFLSLVYYLYYGFRLREVGTVTIMFELTHGNKAYLVLLPGLG